jgi:hypothetical protein
MQSIPQAILALLLLMGVLGVIVSIVYPRQDPRTSPCKRRGNLFIRGCLTIIICAAGLILSFGIHPKQVLLLAWVILALKEYVFLSLRESDGRRQETH